MKQTINLTIPAHLTDEFVKTVRKAEKNITGLLKSVMLFALEGRSSW